VSKLGPDNTPRALAAAGWQVEASPPNAGSEHPSTVRLAISGTGRSRLTGAGLSAVLGQVASYMTGAKCTAIQLRAGSTMTPGYTVTTSGGWVDVLPEDGPTQLAALVAVLVTAGNVT